MSNNINLKNIVAESLANYSDDQVKKILSIIDVPLVKHISTAFDAYGYVKKYADKKQEYFLCITLDGSNKVIKTRVITIGLANCTQVHPREIFCDAIKDRACSIIVAHNHPSGSLVPSSEDIKVTERLAKASKIIGIKLLDHLIISSNGYESIRESDMVFNPLDAS